MRILTLFFQWFQSWLYVLASYRRYCCSTSRNIVLPFNLFYYTNAPNAISTKINWKRNKNNKTLNCFNLLHTFTKSARFFRCFLTCIQHFELLEKVFFPIFCVQCSSDFLSFFHRYFFKPFYLVNLFIFFVELRKFIILFYLFFCCSFDFFL